VDTQLGVARLRKDDDPMGRFRRKHSREFKLEAVKQVVEQTVVRSARSLTDLV
jgi:transposase-like protein